MKRLVACLALALLARSSASAQSSRFYTPIRNNDLPALRTLLRTQVPLESDAAGDTPLMLAAAVGSLDSMRLLLTAGADPNAANKAGATPLMWCAGDAAKVRLLLSKGARVAAQSKAGRTPLEIAASYDNNGDAARLMIEKGADVNARDKGNFSVLTIAASSNNIAIAQMLIAKGADVNAVDVIGFTPLIDAAGNGLHNAEMVQLLLEHGAKVNARCLDGYGTVQNGPIRLGRLTALHQAASANYDAVKALVDAGADVNALDARKATPLVFAVATDHADPRIVQLLVDRGADREPAIEWARRYNSPAILKILGVTSNMRAEAGTSATATDLSSAQNVRASVEKALAACQPPASQFQKSGGCISCHAQIMTGLAAWSAKALNLHADYVLEKAQVQATVNDCKALEQDLFQLQGPPSGIDGMESAFLHLEAGGEAPSLTTDALVHYILSLQQREGDWPVEGNIRPPSEDGSFTATAKAIGILHRYALPGLKSEMDASVARGVRWLKSAEPISTEDRTMQILGLVHAGSKAPADRVRQLISRQRRDGGWGQTDDLPSDAYATGETLLTLHEAGIRASDPVYKRGVNYLLRTQQATGAWHVVTRALTFQPYFESGFPYEQDQWISQAGTAYASMALTFAAK